MHAYANKSVSILNLFYIAMISTTYKQVCLFFSVLFMFNMSH